MRGVRGTKSTNKRVRRRASPMGRLSPPRDAGIKSAGAGRLHLRCSAPRSCKVRRCMLSSQHLLLPRHATGSLALPLTAGLRHFSVSLIRIKFNLSRVSVYKCTFRMNREFLSGYSIRGTVQNSKLLTRHTRFRRFLIETALFSNVVLLKLWLVSYFASFLVSKSQFCN